MQNYANMINEILCGLTLLCWPRTIASWVYFEEPEDFEWMALLKTNSIYFAQFTESRIVNAKHHNNHSMFHFQSVNFAVKVRAMVQRPVGCRNQMDAGAA